MVEKDGKGYLVIAYDGEAVRWRDITFTCAMTGATITREKLLASGHSSADFRGQASLLPVAESEGAGSLRA